MKPSLKKSRLTYTWIIIAFIYAWSTATEMSGGSDSYKQWGTVLAFAKRIVPEAMCQALAH